MMLIAENPEFGEKTISGATLSTTNPTRSGLGSNSEHS